jgi:hypothetical protein
VDSKAFKKNFSEFVVNTTNESYLIHRFYQIGMCNPFFDESEADDYRLPKDFSVGVYPRERYEQGHSPLPIYIPDAVVMFTMMRAAIDVK